MLCRDRHADDRQQSVARDHAGEVRRTAGTRNNNFDACVGGRFAKLGHQLRCAVGGDYFSDVRHL